MENSNIETKPTPFYSQKQDDKYSLLGRSIGVDTQTEYFTTRTIESSNLIPGDLNGQRLNFNFTVSPSAYIDWNNCNMEIGFTFTNAAKNGKAENVSIPWNLLLSIFEEIKVKFNGSVIFNKVAGEYLETQTFKLLTEYTNEDLNASEIVFAPVGDYNYNIGLENGFDFDKADYKDPNAKIRFQNWISPYADNYKLVRFKRPTFKDLFFSMPGFSKNLRNITIDIKLKDTIGLANIINNAAGNEKPLGILLIKKMSLQIHEYNFSPSAAFSAINNKIHGENEHLSFIDVNKQDRDYSSYVNVPSQENIQWVAVTQFCHNVSSKVGARNGMKYQNCGQFLLLNGYGTDSTNNASINNIISRSDLYPEYFKTTRPYQEGDGEGQDPVKIIIWYSCHGPISSIQAQYGNLIYPSNAIDTKIKFNVKVQSVHTGEEEGDDIPAKEQYNTDIELLRTDGLYNEYRKAVGFKNPAVPEDIFKKTMPFFMVRFTPNIKLMQTGDIIIRMPGFSGAGNIGAQNAKVSIIYGQLKSFNISPSGIISESTNN